jgi:diphthine-ammonia ligase
MPHDDWKTYAECLAFICSWSGGKDSCLALYRAMKTGRPLKLFTMLDETGLHSRSHRLPGRLLDAQAAALGLPRETRMALWGGYEGEFISALKVCKAEGAEAAVFGDIDIEEHGLWEEKVCAAAGLRVSLPLWQEDRRALMEEFLGLGFRAVIVVVNESMLDPSFLGRELSAGLMEELERAGADICGENGEYHTAVLDGPIFKRPVIVRQTQMLSHDGYSFLALEV